MTMKNDTKGRKRKDNNEGVVFIGKKDRNDYVMSVLMQFNQGQNEVSIKSRGNNNSMAIDVAECVRNRMLPGVTYKDVIISTDVVKDANGRNANVSALNIILAK